MPMLQDNKYELRHKDIMLLTFVFAKGGSGPVSARFKGTNREAAHQLPWGLAPANRKRVFEALHPQPPADTFPTAGVAPRK